MPIYRSMLGLLVLASYKDRNDQGDMIRVYPYCYREVSEFLFSEFHLEICLAGTCANNKIGLFHSGLGSLTNITNRNPY